MIPRAADIDWHAALALLQWQIELGADEALGDLPVNRYVQAEGTRPTSPRSDGAAIAAAAPDMAAALPVDTVAEAERAAAAAASLAELADAMRDFAHCELKKGARNLVFADGDPAARVMVIGEAPGREEDSEGRPFVGKAGQLLDRMFAAIGLARGAPDAQMALYLVNALPWRPPGNRAPSPDEIAMLRPFLLRHVELADPDVIVLMGNVAVRAILDRAGAMGQRGKWTRALDRPVLPMAHPVHLLQNPSAKREAWADLLELQSRLRSMT